MASGPLLLLLFCFFLPGGGGVVVGIEMNKFLDVWKVLDLNRLVVPDAANAVRLY